MNLLELSFLVFALAAVLATTAPLAGHRPATEPAAAVAWLLNTIACLFAVIAGVRALRGTYAVVSLGDLGGLGAAALRVDRLSGLFVTISFAAAVPACLAAVHPRGRTVPPTGSDRERTRTARRDRLPALVAATLASVLLVMTADHLFVLLFGWEALTVTFLLLAGYDRSRRGRDHAAVAAGVFGKLSGAALMAGGLLAAGASGSLSLDSFARAPQGAVTAVAFALLLAGFGVKVGLVPVQVWLPPTYTAAPSPARGLMAGVAVNVGFYGMWRTLQALGPPPVWLAVTVLLIAGVTAVLGISHAAVNPDLAGMVSWSSVENAGVTLAGFGAALVGAAAGEQQLVAAGLLAATAQVIAHSAAKTLLFTATDIVERTHGTTDLDAVHGIARRQPWVGAALVVGAMTLAGLPLTAGFASEWLTLESLMQQFRIDSLPMQLASATAAALIALTVGIAGVTFVRLVALAAFSPERRTDADAQVHANASRPILGEQVAIVLLVLGCLGTAAAAPWEVQMISAGLRPLVGTTVDGAHADRWTLQPVYAGFSALSPSLLWVVIPLLSVLSAAIAFGYSGRRLFQVRRVPAWSSGSPGVERGVGYTSFGYANPIRKVLANILLTQHQLHEVEEAEQQESRSELPMSSGAPERAPAPATADLLYRVDIVEVVERYLYQPAGRVLMRTARLVTRFQSGRLDVYMAYMLIALLSVLAVVTGLS